MVGVEGHNPSGHCLIATKIVDYVPLSVSDDDNLRQAKRQAVDQEFQPADSSDTSSDLSLVGKLVILEINVYFLPHFDPFICEWIDLSCVLLTG